MQARIVLMLVIALVGLTIANEDVAAVSPSAGSTALPVKQTTSLIPTDAITIPRMLSYQGRLTDSLGNPVPDGNYQLTFRLYQQETGGTPFWTEAQTIMVRNGLFSALLGAVTPITSLPDAGTVWLSLQVGIAPELTPRLRIVSSAFSFLSERAANSDLLQGKDTTAFAKANHTHPYVDSAGGAQRVAGYNLTGLDNRYVNENQANSISSTMITDGTILRTDVASGFKAPYADTADYALTAPATDSARVAGNSYRLQGKDTTAFVRTNQANSITSGMIVDGTIASADIANNAITSAKIGNGEVTMEKINQSGATTGQVLKWTGSAWAPRNDSIGQGDNAWVRGTPDSVLYTIRQLGIARGGTNNMLYGSYCYTHTNLGVACTTGMNGQDKPYCTVSGGYANAALADQATVGGGFRNRAESSFATIAGGYGNSVRGNYSTVGGGHDNETRYSFATVAGGDSNFAVTYCAIGGGKRNQALGTTTTIGGGYSNIAWGYYGVIGGGYQNSLGGYDCPTIGGGRYNFAGVQYTTVSGGYGNYASGFSSTIGGGYTDTVKANYGGILSGYSNLAGDTEEDTAAMVCGGYNNSATAKFAFIGGGYGNTASGSGATVGGGYLNTASGNYATVPGGYDNVARGSVSFAAGRYARAKHSGSFVWSDSAVSASESVYTTGNDQFRVRARGGTWFFSNAGMTTGVVLASGSNSWASACDSTNKTDFAPVDKKELLRRVAELRVRYYRMKDQTDGTRHLGPVAQDFKNAFGVGESDKTINMADADGVLFAAVQALYEENQELIRRIEALETQLKQGR